MPISEDDRIRYLKVFEREIKPGWVVRLIERLEAVYPDSYAACSAYDEAEARDLRPHVLRASVETVLIDVTKEFAHRGMTTPAVMNSMLSQSHREVLSGRVVLTSSAVESPKEVVRLAEFRKQLARSVEISMFGGDDRLEPIENDERFYGIILHGAKRIRNKRDYRKLGFVYLAVPREDCEGYITTFNLAKRYANADVDPEDITAAVAAGVPVEKTRRPSALLKEWGRREGKA